MKNLKLFVFALCAVLLSVVTVNAATPNAQIGNLECYGDIGQCLNYAFTNGGTLNINADVPKIDVSRHTINGNVVIDAHGHKLPFENVSYTATNGKSLTIKNAIVTVKDGSVIPFKVDAGSSLVLDNVTAGVKDNNVRTYVENRGITAVNGGTILSCASDEVFRNYGDLTLNNVNVTGSSTGALVNVEKHGTKTTVNAGTYKVNTLLVSPNSSPKAASLADDTDAETPAKVVLNGGTYTTNTKALNLDHGIDVTLVAGTVKAITDDVVDMFEANLTMNGGSLVAVAGTGIYVGPSTKATLKITNGLVQTNGAYRYALYLENKNATYAISGGTFESKGTKDQAAIYLQNMTSKVENETITLDKSVLGILTGGKYLNTIVAKAQSGNLTADVTDQLVAEGYAVKTEDPYKVVVSTKAPADTTKPGAPGKEEAPNTFDAGLVYMGLALSAIGASVVSVRKLRNN